MHIMQGWFWFLTRKAVNTGWWEIDIHACYSLVKIAFAPICACKNNRRIWRHNASISRSRDVTEQLWWRHNAKSKKTVLDDICDMNDRWLFSEKMCVKDIQLRVRNKIIHSLPWITIFGSLVMRFTNDFHSWLRHSWKSLLKISETCNVLKVASPWRSIVTSRPWCLTQLFAPSDS